VVLVETNEPGNLGAIIRTADAAGADAIVLDGGSDPYNGKAVRASAGSLFHLPVISSPSLDFVAGAHQIGMSVLATSGYAEADLDDLATMARWLGRRSGSSAAKPTACRRRFWTRPTCGSRFRCTDVLRA